MKKLIIFILVAVLFAGCSSPLTQSAGAPNSNPSRNGAQTTVQQPQRISAEEAKRIALEHAGLNEGAAKSLSVDLDDGEYEVEFYTKGLEYNYEIDAYTGQILSVEKDRD